ncbi:unnamed protein product [Rangifer tarandus platyrhynchus]|uniref:Uncharacterized protein n=1 Tax=Rangifer tarandus platyrhynchus TaxID=3082113 RepID=A0AC59YMX8_RANTA
MWAVRIQNVSLITVPALVAGKDRLMRSTRPRRPRFCSGLLPVLPSPPPLRAGRCYPRNLLLFRISSSAPTLSLAALFYLFCL